MANSMLSGYRVLDLTSNEAQFCGRMLADMGMDVIRVEKPGGDECRNVGPFYGDIIHPEKSLWWFALNANKKSITLNLESNDGQSIFKKLVARADILLENNKPGYMASLGLDYPILREINPKLIMTSMSAFGQTGPYSDFKSAELILNALGVFLYGIGDADRPPCRPNFPLAGMASAIHASTATMIAHYYCSKTGQGQYIDVSAQAGVPWFTGNIGAWWQMEHLEMPRAGAAMIRRPDLLTRFIWPCADGYVIFQFYGGVVGLKSNKALAKWMNEENFGDDYFKNLNWDHFSLYTETQAVVHRLEDQVALFFKSKGKHELATEGTTRGILLGYISDVRELHANPQLAARNFWKEIEHPELGKSISYPGFFFTSSLLECMIRRRAPLIGENNLTVYTELGLSGADLNSLNQAGII